MYIYNIYHFINSYSLEYHWLNLNEHIFYNGVKNLKPSNYDTFSRDPWLKKYANKKIQLAEDIIRNGTFTPIFYYEINNNKYILGGKHRIYSLKLYSILYPINRKFLFIKLPIEHNELNPINPDQKLFYFNHDTECPIMKDVLTSANIWTIFVDTGDALSPWLHENKAKPFTPFNDEQLFEKWISEELKYE